jgi:hypothetical protein
MQALYCAGAPLTGQIGYLYGYLYSAYPSGGDYQLVTKDREFYKIQNLILKSAALPHFSKSKIWF